MLLRVDADAVLRVCLIRLGRCMRSVVLSSHLKPDDVGAASSVDQAAEYVKCPCTASLSVKLLYVRAESLDGLVVLP